MENDSTKQSPVDYGRRVFTETFQAGRLHSIEMSTEEVIDAVNTKDAVEIVTQRVMDILFMGAPKKNIVVQLDLNDSQPDPSKKVRRVHITQISAKEQIPVHKHKK